LEHLRRHPLPVRDDFCNCAVAHSQDARGHRANSGVVGDDHSGRPQLAVDSVERREHDNAGFHVQCTRRFVAQEHIRLLGDRTCDGHTLLLAARHLRREAIQAVPEAHQGERFLGVDRSSGDSRDEGHVLTRGQVRQQVIELKDEAHVLATELGQRRVVIDGQIVVEKRDRPARRGVEPAQDVDERRLAAPRWSEQNQKLAGLDIEVDVTQRPDGGFARTVDLGQPARLKHWRRDAVGRADRFGALHTRASKQSPHRGYRRHAQAGRPSGNGIFRGCAKNSGVAAASAGLDRARANERGIGIDVAHPTHVDAFARIGSSLYVLANARLTRVGCAAALLVVITACCVRAKPEQPVSEPPAAAAPQSAVQGAQPATEPAPEPPQRQPVEAPPPVAIAPAPTAPDAPRPSATPQEPPAIPKQNAAAPAQQTPGPAPAPTPAPRKPAVAPAPPRDDTATRPTPAKPAAPLVPEGNTTASVSPLDLNRLKQGLKDTRAIGIFSKLTLKNQMDDLLDWFREYHWGKGKRSLTDLRRSFDLLVMKVLSLVQDEDKKLASDIVGSREAIWGLLADPKAFVALDV
jgi:hypothetical protein